MRPRLHPLAVALLVGGCGDVAIVDDVVFSRLTIDEDATVVRRDYTAGLFLRGGGASTDGSSGRPTVTPTFTLEVQVDEEGALGSTAHVLVLQVDDDTVSAPIDVPNDGHRSARLELHVRCPRRWDPCLRIARVTIERDGGVAPVAGSAFGLRVRVASRYRSGRRDEHYGEHAEIVRVTVP